MPKLVARGLTKEDFDRLKREAKYHDDASSASKEKFFPLNADGSPKQGSRGERPASKLIPFLELFRYASRADWVMIIIATLASLITGYAQIHLIIAWGDAINIAAGTKADAKQANLETFLTFVTIGIVSGVCAW